MKVLVILLVLVGFVTISYSISDVSAICMVNEDWSDAPCFSEKRGNDPSLNQMRQSWMQYYDFKGKEWMESKKQELIEAIQNEKLLDWKMSDPKGSNSNVYTYYFLMGDIPNENGLFADEYYGIKYLSPLKQKNSNVKLNEIHCGINLVLLQKYDGTPACVTESTKTKLIERGWTGSKVTKPVSNNYNPYETKCASGVIPYIPKNWHETKKQPSDEEWEKLGRHLMKAEFSKQLKQQNIIFEPACFGINKGSVEWSYPPRISMCAIVNELNGDKIYLEGIVHGFDVIDFEMTRTIPYPCDELSAGCFCNMENKN